MYYEGIDEHKDYQNTISSYTHSFNLQWTVVPFVSHVHIEGMSSIGEGGSVPVVTPSLLSCPIVHQIIKSFNFILSVIWSINLRIVKIFSLIQNMNRNFEL